MKRTIKGSAIALLFGVLSTFLLGFYGFAPGALLVPFFIILTLHYGGFTGVMAAALLLLVAAVQWGILGAVLFFLAFMPITVVMISMLKKRAPVHLVFYYGSATMLVSLLCFFMIYTLVTGSDVATDLAAYTSSAMLAVAESLDKVGAFPALPDRSLITATSYVELIQASMPEISDSIRAQVLPHMVFMSCLSGLLGATLPIRSMRRRAKAEMVSALSPLYSWRIPRKVSTTLIGAYMATVLLSMMGVPGIDQVSASIWQVIQVVYASSCLSFLSFWMHRQGITKGKRMLLYIVCGIMLFFMQTLGFFVSFLYVLIGMTGELKRSKSPRTFGDLHGPFGPYDTIKKSEDTIEI